MRILTAILVGLTCTTALAQAPKADAPAKRYGIDPQPDLYPQNAPKETLASVLKAIERKRIPYLLAQLADPKFVDERVKVYGGNFDTVVEETTKRLAGDPGVVKELQRFLDEGEWSEAGDSASASLKDVKNRGVYFRKIGDRWFLENRVRPESK